MDYRATTADFGATRTKTDLLVSYPGKQYARARRELIRLATEVGDAAAWVEKTSVWGIAVLHGTLDSREVIRRCRALWHADPANFRFAIKWAPVDHWCNSDLPAIKAVIDRDITPRIGPNQAWAMRVHKRRWERYSTHEIIRYLTTDIPGTVDLTKPEWIVWVDVVGKGTAVSLLRPDEIFAPLSSAEPLSNAARE